jgi:hypothetical protein
VPQWQFGAGAVAAEGVVSRTWEMYSNVLRVGLGLLIASSLYMARSSFEMFVLTPRFGPQMLFFSLLHMWPYPLALLFIASWFAYDPTVLFAVLVAVTRLSLFSAAVSSWVAGKETEQPGGAGNRWARGLVRWFAGPPGRTWSYCIFAIAMVLLVHFVAASTYMRWSRWFSSTGG